MKITAVHYGIQKEGGSANITKVKLDNGTIISIEEAIEMCRRGELPECTVGRTRGVDSHETLRAAKDDYEDNNLSSLPRFE